MLFAGSAPGHGLHPMQAGFQQFSFEHWIVLALVPITALLLADASLRWPATARPIRICLAAIIAAQELIWCGYRYLYEGYSLAQLMPLELCSLSVWGSVLILLTLHPVAFDLVYYWGLAGATQALLTPNFTTPLFTLQGAAFFLSHGGIVAAILLLIRTRLARPRPGSWWRAFLGLNLAAAVAGLWDWWFGTNFMFLRHMPYTPSALDLLGPWPVYIAVGDLVGLLLFLVLWLPWWLRDRRLGAAPA